MALQKIKELDNTGLVGDYWKISTVENEYMTNQCTVVLHLYVSKIGRENGKKPLPETKKFVFSPSDHPFENLNVQDIDVNLIETWEDMELHARYLHIKNVAQIALEKNNNGEYLSPNEEVALFFSDAENV